MNLRHLEPTTETVDVKKGAQHAEVVKALGITEGKKKADKKEKAARPVRVRKKKVYATPKKEKKAAPAKAVKAPEGKPAAKKAVKKKVKKAAKNE